MATTPPRTNASVEVDALNRSIKSAATEAARLARTTRKLEQAMEEASNGAIDKAAEALADLAKQSSILEDSVKENIKANKVAPKQLAKVIDRLEKQGDVLIDAQKKYKSVLAASQRQAAAALKAAGGDAKAAKLAAKDARKQQADAIRQLRQEFRALGLSAKDAVKNIDALAAEGRANKVAIQRAAADLSKPSAKIGKALDGMHSKVQTSILGLGQFSAVMSLAKKAVTELYGQSIRLANKGLVGSMMQMNLSAMKLRMTAEEFEGLVEANRDMITLMGGGAQGIANFEAILTEASVDLEVFGKEGKKAAATILSGFNRAGFGLLSTNQDVAQAYATNIKAINKQFKMFKGAFNDTAEQFAALYEQQLKSETIQAKLLSGDTKGVALQMQEIMARTENLKLMGLNNEQIIAMSKRMDSLFNPLENNQGDVQTQRVATRQAMALGASAVRGVAPELADRIEEVLRNRQMELMQREHPSKIGSNPAFAQISKDMAMLEQVITAERAKDGGGSSNIGNAFVSARKLADKNYTAYSETGNDLLRAKAQGNAQTEESKARIAREGLANSFTNLDGSTTRLGEAFGALRAAVEQTTALLNNPFTNTLAAFGAGLLFASSRIRGAVVSAASTMLKAGKSMFSGIGGFMKGLWGLLKKFPVLSAIFGIIEGSYKSYNTKTSEYAERFGMEDDGSLIDDLTLRTMGLASDVANATVKNLTFRTVDIGKNWQASKPPTGLIPSMANLPNAQVAKTPTVAEAFAANPNLPGFLQAMAQLETRGGKSTIKGPGGADSNNLYNVKTNKGGFRAYDKAEGSNDAYQVYGSREEATAHLIQKLGRQWPGTLTAKTPEEFAMALRTGQQGGYATDPNYVSKFVGVAKSPATKSVDILGSGVAPAAVAAPAPTSSARQLEGSSVLGELQKQTTLLGSMVTLLGKTQPSGKGWQISREEGINQSSGS